MNSRLSFSSVFLSLLLMLPAAVFSQPSQEKPVAAEPGFARFVTVQGDRSTQSVTIHSNEAGPFKVLDVTSPVSWITVKFHKAAADERVDKGTPGNAQYRLDIVLDSTTATIGPIAERITIKTNSATTPEILFPVSGSVRHAGPPTRASSGSEGRVTGVVVDTTGAPIPDVTMAVIDQDGKPYDIAKLSKSDGTFSFFIIDARVRYKMHLEKPGYTSLDQDLELKVGDTIRITYTLKPKP